MNNKHNIFILEDNEEQRDILKNLLSEEYNIFDFKDTKHLDVFPLNKIDLFILDWEIANSNITGQEFCYYLKKELNLPAPVIIHTAKINPACMEKGLHSGAVDYITKPSDLNLLKIKIENHLLYKNYIPKNFIEYKGIKMDLDSNKVSFEGEEITLSKKPFSILFHMLQEPHKIFSRKELNDLINEGIAVSNRNVDTHIVNIRNKFKPLKIITTVHGFGYKINY
jgi:DNA-binding response OmpR family regulator